MKLAISGKGGVGKTTFASFLIRALTDKGRKVLAIDADPDANLAQALGVEASEKIVPISKMKDLIEERTETKLGTMGGFFATGHRWSHTSTGGYGTDPSHSASGRKNSQSAYPANAVERRSDSGPSAISPPDDVSLHTQTRQPAFTVADCRRAVF